MFAPKGATTSLRHVPLSLLPTLGRWLVYNTVVCVGVKVNGSWYFFSAVILSTLAICLSILVESL